MENNAENIDRYFQEKLGALEQVPRDQVWKEIEGKLVGPKSKRSVYFMLRIAAGMTLLASLSLGYYMVRHQESQEQERMTMAPGDPAVKENGSDAPPMNPASEPAPHAAEKVARPVHVHAIKNTAHLFVAFDQLNVARKSEAGNRYPELLNHSETGRLARVEPRNAGPFLVKQPLQRSPRETKKPENTSSDPYDPYADFRNDAGESLPKQYQWAVGSEAAPMYTFRTITSDYYSNSYMKDLERNESGMVAFAGGLNVSLSKGRRLSVQSGVYYARYGQEKNNVEAYTSKFADQSPETRYSTYFSISNSTGTIQSNDQETESGKILNYGAAASGDMNFFDGIAGLNTNSLTQANYSDLSVSQEFEYIEVPLTMKYKLIDRKLDFSLQGGVITNFLVGNKVYLNNEGESQVLGKTSDINKINYQGSVGLGFEYPILSNLAFNIEPRFRYYINPIDNKSQINVHPYSFGIFAGISFLFR